MQRDADVYSRILRDISLVQAIVQNMDVTDTTAFQQTLACTEEVGSAVRTCNCDIGLRQHCVEAEVRTKGPDRRAKQHSGYSTSRVGHLRDPTRQHTLYRQTYRRIAV